MRLQSVGHDFVSVWEGGSGWGTRVCLWRIPVDMWQNQYNIVKFKNKIKLKKEEKKRKGRGTRDQIANVQWIIENSREFQKNVYFCFTDYTKAFDCVDYNKMWKILKEMGLADHLTAS